MSSSDRGFTLIELMVALTLLGLIATMLASGTRLSLDISARGNKKAEELRTTEIQRSLVRRQLQGALPFRYWNQVEGKRVQFLAFDGTVDRILFVSRDGITDGPDGFPRWVEIRRDVSLSGSQRAIVVERRILSPDNQPSQTAIAQTEILNCAELQFQYLDSTGETPQWRSNWTGTDRPAALPSAIRVQCGASEDALKLLVPLDYAESARQGMILQ